MKLMTQLLGMAILPFLLSSCSTNQSKIEATFEDLIVDISNADIDGIYANLDPQSTKYLDSLAQRIKRGSWDDASALGASTQIELTTLFLYEQIQDAVASSKEFSGQDVLFVMYLNGIGILRSAGANKLAIREMGRITNYNADVKVRVPTGGNAAIVSTYKFTKVNQDWKLNLPSTLSLNEKLLKDLINCS